jgi:hypothetical protein
MECQNNNSCGAGKGDKPRNCFSQQYRDNYDSINWNKNKELSKNEKEYIDKIKDGFLLPIPSTPYINN